MPKKKAAAKRNATRNSGTRPEKAKASGLTPNDLPDPLNQEHVQALQITCQFLGKTFYQGDTICYENSEWVCGSGGWSKTGQSC